MSTLTASVTLSENGSIPVPAELRRALGLSPRQKLRLSKVDNRILVEVEPSGPPALGERAAQLVKEAKLQATYDAVGMTADEVWAAYDAAATTIRQSLTYKRKRRR